MIYNFYFTFFYDNTYRLREKWKIDTFTFDTLLIIVYSKDESSSMRIIEIWNVYSDRTSDFGD